MHDEKPFREVYIREPGAIFALGNICRQECAAFVAEHARGQSEAVRAAAATDFWSGFARRGVCAETVILEAKDHGWRMTRRLVLDGIRERMRHTLTMTPDIFIPQAVESLFSKLLACDDRDGPSLEAWASRKSGLGFDRATIGANAVRQGDMFQTAMSLSASGQAFLPPKKFSFGQLLTATDRLESLIDLCTEGASEVRPLRAMLRKAATSWSALFRPKALPAPRRPQAGLLENGRHAAFPDRLPPGHDPSAARLPEINR